MRRTKHERERATKQRPDRLGRNNEAVDTDHETRIVRTVAETWQTMIDDKQPLPLTPTHCILGARAGVEALTYFGLPAKAVAVIATVRNQPAVALARQGIPTDQWPQHAWSLSVGRPGDEERAVAESAGRGMNLHLVIEIPDSWIVDLSAGQFDRNDYDLHVPGPIVTAGGFDTANRCSTTTPRGTLVTYERRVPAPQWRQSLDWTINYRNFARELINRSRPLLQP